MRSPGELAGRGLQRLRIVSERIGLGPMGRATPEGPLIPSLPFPRPSRADLGRVYAGRPAEARRLLEHADAAMTGRFHLLGLRDLNFGSPVDWACDPTRGRRAADVHWSRIAFLDEASVGDHKIVWELNRHQWMVTLAQAWRLTADERYALAVARFLESWLDANPARRGINWASSLELAYRAIAWTWTLHLLDDRMSDSLRPRLRAALELHGIQIERFLSTWFSPNTHLTGEALGLLYLGTAWPGLRLAGRWRAAGWRILIEELPLHVREDGTYFEQSTWYQAYTTDIYLHGILLARAAGLPIPSWMEERIARAATVIAELKRADGTLPLIGDDDGGRLLPLCPDRTDFRDTTALAALVLGRPALTSPDEVPAATSWFAGASRTLEMMAGSPVPRSDTSRAFALGGLYLLRGKSGSMTVDAGPHGALAGGHSHADALSLEWSVGGRAVVVDPGTGSYVGSWRDWFRATSAHNTLSLADGTGSATPTGPFQWGRWPRTRVLHWSSGAGWAALVAEHDGFATVHPGLVHRRTVWFRDDWGWLVMDRLLGPGTPAVLRFQLDTDFVPAVQGQVVTLTSPRDSEVLMVSGDGAGVFTIEAALVSHCHGEATAAPAILRNVTVTEAAVGVATLLTARADVSIARDPGTFASAWLWRSGDQVARLALRDDGVAILLADERQLILHQEGG